MKLSSTYLYIGVAVVCAGIAGFAIGNNNQKSQATPTDQIQYPLLAKRILIDNPNDAIVKFVPLRKEIERRFQELQVPYSFYFEYLPTGTSIRVGDDVALVGASLLKLPIVMDLYKAAETGKINIDEQVVVEAEMLNDDYGKLYQKGAGYKLSLREAAAITLEESDNTAINVIEKSLYGKLQPEEGSMAAVDADFNTVDNAVVINSKSYASILKCLYFACFNNFNDSQEILSHLTQATSQGRLIDGVPDSIAIAHKFGTSLKNITDSDCGIFYIPNRPYIVCVMIKLPAEDASKFDTELSRIIYDAVINQEAN